MRLHHLGIACADIGQTLDQLRQICVVTCCSETVHDPEQDAELCLVSVQGSLPLELIAGPVVANLVKKGMTLYHSCWEVPDLDAALERVCAAGGKLISPPKPALLFGSRRVAFLSTDLGLLELLEAPRP